MSDIDPACLTPLSTAYIAIESLITLQFKIDTVAR